MERMLATKAKHIQRDLVFTDNGHAQALYGELNRNLKVLENSCGVQIDANGSSLKITGFAHDVELVFDLLNQLYELICNGYPVYESDIAFGLKVLEEKPQARLKQIFLDKVYVTTQRRVISPKTQNQKLFIDTIRQRDIVFALGPAGTGKTYLAVAMAVAALTSGHVQSIILTRPAVEAGEKLGFLPGDLIDKVNPYLRPLYDALYDILGPEKTADSIERGALEIAPLAFMRGRTLNNAFIILDEAQNTTQEQMKMFLTRIGFASRAVITGDLTQVDLPVRNQSGLLQAERLLSGIDGIGFCRFTQTDVVRHPLVRQIIDAYEHQ